MWKIYRKQRNMNFLIIFLFFSFVFYFLVCIFLHKVNKSHCYFRCIFISNLFQCNSYTIDRIEMAFIVYMSCIVHESAIRPELLSASNLLP